MLPIPDIKKPCKRCPARFVVVTVGLEPTVTIRNRLPASLALAISLCSLELRPPSSRTAGGGLRSPIDVNDVLSLCG